MILTFNDYESLSGIDFNSLGEINESHQYADSIASVMDKLTFFVKRNVALENSSLNESAKRAYNKDIKFNRNERIATVCIFNEMLKQFEKNMKDELALYEAIISNGDLLEEGVEYDCDSLFDALSLDEGLKDKFKELWNSGKNTVKVAAKEILDDVKELPSKGFEIVKTNKDKVVKLAKDAKNNIEERYLKLKKLIDEIVKKGIDSIQAFINNLLDVFTSIGDDLVDSVKKLGGLEMDKDEKPAKLEGIDDEELYKNVKGEGEKSFFNNVILRVEAILSKDKENAAKLMTESYLEESIVDNKFIAWLAGYKSDGTKMSWWKCILIGLCASLIVWVLPKVLVVAGLVGALAAFIAALVGVTWNGIGMLKLIYKRNKERKPGEKFFDKKTSIFFALSILSTCFSVATFLKTIGPLMREICNSMGWTGGDDMSKFGEFIYGITKKISPKNAFQEGGIKEWTEEIQNYGGDVRGSNLTASADEAEKLMNNMPGATEANKDAFKDFLDAAKGEVGTSKIYKAWEAFKDNKDLPLTGVFDTSKWGGSGPIKQAMDALKDSGAIPDSAILGTVGSEATKAASKGMYGFSSYITGVNKDQMNMIFQKAAEIAGKDASQLQLHFYGTGSIADTLTHTDTLIGSFNVLAPDKIFSPVFIPFFDKKKWGTYKIRFGSSTSGAPAFVVDEVKVLKKEDVVVEGKATAWEELQNLHNESWEAYKKNFEKINNKVDEGKKTDNELPEEPQYIAFYVRPNEDTGNKNDKTDKKSDSNKPAIGVIIDSLTMMAADVCNFNESTGLRKRTKPYFMKGLFSKLSFIPVKSNDNETKNYIRQTLGQTVRTLMLQNILLGKGIGYIQKVKNEKEHISIENIDDFNNIKFETGKFNTWTGEKLDNDKEYIDLGNFSPNEIVKCLNDNTNKEAYASLDGSNGSIVNIKKTKDGITKVTSKKDTNTLEKLKFFEISEEEYKKMKESLTTDPQNNPKSILSKKNLVRVLVNGERKYYRRLYKYSEKYFKGNESDLLSWADVKIKPLLTDGKVTFYKKRDPKIDTTLPDTLKEDKLIKKMFYDGEGKLNEKVYDILKPFLYRPEKTFAKDDEHELGKQLEKEGIKGEKLGWFKNLFKNEEQVHDTFKKAIEIIWDYLTDNTRTYFKQFDYNPKTKKTEEYTCVFDELIEESFNEESYYEDDEIEMINETRKPIPSFQEWLKKY